MCYPCKKSDHHAQGCATCTPNTRRTHVIHTMLDIFIFLVQCASVKKEKNNGRMAKSPGQRETTDHHQWDGGGEVPAPPNGVQNEWQFTEIIGLANAWVVQLQQTSIWPESGCKMGHFRRSHGHSRVGDDRRILCCGIQNGEERQCQPPPVKRVYIIFQAHGRGTVL